MKSSGRSASGKEGGDSGGRMSDSHKSKPGREESFATAEEEDAPLKMKEVVAEKSDMAEDFNVDENLPDILLRDQTAVSVFEQFIRSFESCKIMLKL
jgi:hypothetical protein